MPALTLTQMRFAWAGVLTALALATPVQAELVAPPSYDLAKALERCDLVVAGKGNAIKEGERDTVWLDGREVAGVWRSLSFAVDRWIKGTGPVALDVWFFDPDDRLRRPSLDSAFPRPPTDKRCLLFLASDAPSKGRIALAQGEPPVPVILFLSDGAAAARGSAATAPAAAAGALREEIVAAAGATDAAIALPALDALRWVPGTAAQVRETMPLLSRLSRSADLGVASAALALRIRAADAGAVREAAAWAAQLPQASTGAGRISEAVASLRPSADPSVLAPCLGSPDAALRQAATYALRKTGGRAVVPLLAERLADPDRGVQYHALMGLGAATDREGPLTPEVTRFLENPQPYVDAWRQWWQTEGRQRFATTQPAIPAGAR